MDCVHEIKSIAGEEISPVSSFPFISGRVLKGITVSCGRRPTALSIRCGRGLRDLTVSSRHDLRGTNAFCGRGL